jgi:hypothetical protein
VSCQVVVTWGWAGTVAARLREQKRTPLKK